MNKLGELVVEIKAMLLELLGLHPGHNESDHPLVIRVGALLTKIDDAVKDEPKKNAIEDKKVEMVKAKKGTRSPIRK